MSQNLVNEIDRVGRRWRSVATRAATARTAAVGLGVATLLVLVDWLGRFDDAGLRWLATGLFAASIGAAVYRGWRELAGLDASRLAVARKVETMHPALGSRLASAVEFYDGEPDDPRAGSTELRRAVVVDAATRVEGLDLDEAVDTAPLRLARRLVLGAAAAFGVLSFGAPAAVSTGLARLAAPWAEIDWPRVNELALVEEVTAVAIGEAFEVAAIDRAGDLPDDLRIEYRFEAPAGDAAPVETEAMRLVGDQAVARREEVRRPFAYRVVGGDDETMPWIDVAVVEPPRLEGFRVGATPPAYSGLAAGPIDGPVRVLEGTALDATGVADKPTASAWIETPGDERVPLLIETSAEAVALRTAAGAWTAATVDSPNRSFRVALESSDGLVGRSEPRPYDVVIDEPPSVVWRKPEGDVFVTARAVVPVGVLVADDLAVASVTLEAEANAASTPGDEAAGESAAGAPDAPPTESVELYAGPAAPPARGGLDEGDRLTLDDEWDLEPLRLTPGTRFDLVVTAADYRPSVGRTELPRRVFIVTDEEFESRLAQQQSRLLAEVERSLERQRSARDRSKSLSIDVASGEPLDRATLDRLATLEFEQRQAGGALDDPGGGAVRLAEELLEALRTNRVDRPELSEQLRATRDELEDVAGGAMADARRDLASARRAAERGVGEADDGGVSAPLGEAERRQSEAVERLEAVAEALTGWADYQRFAGEVATLRDKQRELAETTEGLAAKAAARDPLGAAELRAEQQKAVVAQAEIGRRFAKLRQAMQRLLENAESGESGAAQDAATDAVADALAEADEAGVAGQLREASRELTMQRLGRAGEPQQQAAEGLERMLEALRGAGGGDPEELLERLREAQQQLAELQERTDDLADQADRGRDDPGERGDVAQDAERLSRALERMTAQQAAGSTQQGAQGVAGDPSPRLDDAQEAFEQAQEEIEQRMEELQEQLAERMLDRLRQKIDDYIERQRGVVEATDGLAETSERTPAKLRREATAIGEAQGALEVEVRVSAEENAGRRVFELALGTTAGEMAAVVERLGVGRVDSGTRRLEQSALERLERIAEVLRDTPPEPEGGGEQQGGGGDGGGQSPPPSPIDVAELKMLRLMQLDLIDKTEAFEAAAERLRRDGLRLPAEGRAASRRLASEQRDLVELAIEMAERNNDPDAVDPNENGE